MYSATDQLMNTVCETSSVRSDSSGVLQGKVKTILSGIISIVLNLEVHF